MNNIATCTETDKQQILLKETDCYFEQLYGQVLFALIRAETMEEAKTIAEYKVAEMLNEKV